MTTYYRAAPAGTLTAVDLPPFTIVFHRASGMTHLLTEPAPQILTAMGDASLTIDDLRERLTAQFELDDADVLLTRLEELVAAGLVAAA